VCDQLGESRKREAKAMSVSWFEGQTPCCRNTTGKKTHSSVELPVKEPSSTSEQIRNKELKKHAKRSKPNNNA
jgi:hypothetical protein